MPRHPPYTLSSLTTLIDHRHSEISNLRFEISNSPGEVRRNKRSITCLIAKKVLDDTRQTKRQPWGSRLCRAGIAKDCCCSGPLTSRQQTYFEPHIFTFQRAQKIPSNTGEIVLQQPESKLIRVWPDFH